MFVQNAQFLSINDIFLVQAWLFKDKGTVELNHQYLLAVP